MPGFLSAHYSSFSFLEIISGITYAERRRSWYLFPRLSFSFLFTFIKSAEFPIASHRPCDISNRISVIPINQAFTRISINFCNSSGSLLSNLYLACCGMRNVIFRHGEIICPILSYHSSPPCVLHIVDPRNG